MSVVKAITPAAAMKTLDQLAPGRRGRVLRIHGRGAVFRRILDMGISKGVVVEVERAAPLGDPLKIRTRGYALSLRKSEARLIEIEPIPGDAPRP